MRARETFLLLLLLFLGLFTSLSPRCPLLAEEAPISIKADPYAGYEPLTVRITVHVPPVKENRSVCVDITDVRESDYYRSSCWQIDEHSPITHVEDKIARELRWVPSSEGENYIVSARLTRMVNGRETSFVTPPLKLRVLSGISRDEQ